MELTRNKYIQLIRKSERAIEKYTKYSMEKYKSRKYSFNERKTSLGRANWLIQRIEISRTLAPYYSEKKILNTLIHEMLHVIANNEKKSNQGHRGLWLKIANKLNKNKAFVKEFGEIVRTYKPSKEDKETSKYIFVCETCNKKVYYHRASDFVKNYIYYVCSTCETMDFKQIKGPCKLEKRNLG